MKTFLITFSILSMIGFSISYETIDSRTADGAKLVAFLQKAMQNHKRAAAKKAEERTRQNNEYKLIADAINNMHNFPKFPDLPTTIDYSLIPTIPPDFHIDQIDLAKPKEPQDTVDDMTVLWRAGIVTCISLILLLSTCGTIIFLRCRDIHKDLIYFLDGNPKLINPNVPIHEQANLLPYDKRFEFPKRMLVRGQRLGSGAFGCVEEAIAYGIIPYEKKTRVAVKMINAQADEEALRTLLLELKILIYLKRHLNVIRLLGAVTINIQKRELFVIVEYCEFGSVKEFLMKHRRFFVDQINHANDQIDYNFVGCPGLLANNECSDSSFGRSTLIAIDEPIIMPDQSSNHNALYPDSNIPLVELASPLRPVATVDLLLWSYQIARGMEYLATLNVVHGDLAARNILLSDGNVVKICDFGLARTMCKKDYYRKNASQGEVKLPFKWLAPESYQWHMFSTSTDVWSFGVLLWELFSLGEEPYQDIHQDVDRSDDLFRRLNDGYRLQQPSQTTERIYSIMLSCWDREPRLRPKFDQLARIFSDIIGADRTKYFDDLNVMLLTAFYDE